MDFREWIHFMVATLVCAVLVNGAPSPQVTQQYLQPPDSVVSVFIRKGDTPLEEIDLGLAKAFKAANNKSPPSRFKTALYYQPIRILPIPATKLYHEAVRSEKRQRDAETQAKATGRFSFRLRGKELLPAAVIGSADQDNEILRIPVTPVHVSAPLHIQKIARAKDERR